MSDSLNASQHLDRTSVDLLLAVDAAAAELSVSYCVVGAFARDVVLGCCFGIDTGQATRDIDFGFLLRDWNQFEALRSRLLQGRGFAEYRGIPHRLSFRGARELDLVPFGGVERKSGEIAWPPEFSTVMSTVGLRQAQAGALHVTVAAGSRIPFASPAALTLLKLVAWSQRGAVNNKDARDLALLLKNYLQAGNESRLYGEYASLLDDDDFDLDAAGAHILGRDLAAIAHGQTRNQLEQILEHGLAAAQGEPLIRALPLRPEQARRLLTALCRGLHET